MLLVFHVSSPFQAYIHIYIIPRMAGKGKRLALMKTANRDQNMGILMLEAEK